MSSITFGYWDIRGLAEPIRYLLHFKKVKFNDKRYQFESEEWWKNDKFSLGLDFPNLPYYIEGDLKLTQSTTILRYLAEKYDLGGKSKEQKLRVSLVEQQLVDLLMRLARVCIDKNFEEVKQEYLEKLPGDMKLLAQFLGDRKFLAGDEVTYVDFMAYHTVDIIRMFMPLILKDFANLQAYQGRMKKLPELQEYFQSPTYRRWPIWGPIAHWGYKGEEPKID